MFSLNEFLSLTTFFYTKCVALFLEDLICTRRTVGTIEKSGQQPLPMWNWYLNGGQVINKTVCDVLGIHPVEPNTTCAAGQRWKKVSLAWVVRGALFKEITSQ